MARVLKNSFSSSSFHGELEDVRLIPVEINTTQGCKFLLVAWGRYTPDNAREGTLPPKKEVINVWHMHYSAKYVPEFNLREIDLSEEEEARILDCLENSE